MSLSLREPVAILGGSSSVGVQLIRLLDTRGIPLLVTYNNAVETVDERAGTRLIHLNLSDWNQCAAAQEEFGAKTQLTLVVLAGGFSGDAAEHKLRPEAVENYCTTWMTNLIGLIYAFFRETNGRGNRVFFMSSRASTKGSEDVLYSAAKAAVATFLRSAAQSSWKQQTLIGSAGLIEGSGMEKEFRPQDVQNHRDRAGVPLLSARDLALQIFKTITNSDVVWDGRTIQFGPDYP